jgi:hypothetical protein
VNKFNKFENKSTIKNNEYENENEKEKHNQINSIYDNLNWQIICETISLLPFRLHKIKLFEFDYIVWRDNQFIIYHNIHCNDSNIENSFHHGKIKINQ